MVSSLFMGLLLSLSLIELVSGLGGCLRVRKGGTSPHIDDPPFNDNDNSPLTARSAVQAIITTYGLYCDCVNITSWETYVQPGGGKHNTAEYYDITFQVWRPSPTVQDDGCYSLVGENVFTSFTFEDGGLVQLTPTPPSNSIITAQSGDVVGYYTNSRSGDDEGIQLERNEDYNQNMIWFLSVADGSLPSSRNNACPYPVGTGRYLSSSTGAAPMLKISSTEVACPPSPSPTTETFNGAMVATTNVQKVSISPSESRITASSTIALEVYTAPLSTQPTTENSNGALSSTVMATICVLAITSFVCISGLALIFFILIARKINKNKILTQNLSKDYSIDQSESRYEVIDTDMSTTTENYSTVIQLHNAPFAMMPNEAYAVPRKKIDDTSLDMMTNEAYAVHKKD